MLKPIKLLGIVLGVIVFLFALVFVTVSSADSPTYAWRLLRLR